MCFSFISISQIHHLDMVYYLQGGCMVGWTNFGVTQSIFLPPKCDSNHYIILYIMELLNGTHFEIIGTMNFWNWKSRCVMLTTIKWMDFGLVLWWTSKTFKELVFIFKFNNEIKLEMVWFISNEFYDLWTFIWWKTSTFSQKSCNGKRGHPNFGAPTDQGD